jgi:GTP:adenosylcobinamide-phosphate guanylyltransferase
MNIGIVIPHTGASQIAFHTIKEINRIVNNGYLNDIIVFFEQLTPPIIKPNCSVMCINELMSFKGILITTTLDNTTMAIARSVNKENKIIYYVWDLEWMRPGKNIYLYNYNAFQRVNKIVARSSNHAKAIENYCNKKVNSIIEEFNIEEIIQ